MFKAALSLGSLCILLAVAGLGSPIVAAYGMFLGMLGLVFGAFSLPKEESEDSDLKNLIAVILPSVAIICSVVVGLL